MSTNDWEKSWKNKLDNYDSPVDSKLFEAIAGNTADNTKTPFLFGWIGLFVVVSTALIIAGFISKTNQNSSIEANKNSEILHVSSLDYLSKLNISASINDPLQDIEMSNSGKYVLAAFNGNNTIDSSIQSNANELVDNVEIKKHSHQKLNDNANKFYNSNSNVKFDAISEVENSDNYSSLIKSEELDLAGLNINTIRPKFDPNFEDAKVRLNAAQPISVLFPVKSKTSSPLMKLPDPDNCFNDAKGRSSFYVDAYVGAGNSIRSLSAIENQGQYMHLRDSLEKSWYNSAAGARIGFILSSGMAIETGAEYQVHNEIFEYKNESEVRITYKYHYDQFGAITRIDTLTEIGTRTLRNHNKYQQITIPLRIGYTMEKGRWMIGARIGVGLHIWNHQQGVILDNSYQTYKIEEDPNEYFNKNWGMQYNASLQIGYRILPQTFLMIEPIWNSQSGGITQRPYTLEQKYQTLRLNVGVRFVPGSYY